MWYPTAVDSGGPCSVFLLGMPRILKLHEAAKLPAIDTEYFTRDLRWKDGARRERLYKRNTWVHNDEALSGVP